MAITNDIISSEGGSSGGGTQPVNTNSVSSTYSVDSEVYPDYLIYMYGNSFTITLPAPTNGRILIFKDASGNATTQVKTISQHASEKIDGQNTYPVNNNNESITLSSDGTSWFAT